MNRKFTGFLLFSYSTALIATGLFYCGEQTNLFILNESGGGASDDLAQYNPRSKASNDQYSYGFEGAAEYYHRSRVNRTTGRIDMADVQKAEAQIRSRASKKSALGLEFTERGPDNVGGRSRAMLVDRTVEDGSKLFAGSVSGGLFVSDNSGGHWKPHVQFMNTAQTSSIIASIEQAPNGDIYVGTGSNFDRFGNQVEIPWPGKGIFRSRDGGETFQSIPSTFPGNINSKDEDWHACNRIKFDPNTGRIYACTSGGLKISDDEGITWVNPITVGPGILVEGEGMDVDVADDGTVIAAVGRRMYHSESGDVGSWTDVTDNGMEEGIRTVLEFAPGNNDYAYALVARSETPQASLKGVYQSKDKGKSWARILSPIPDYFNPLSRSAEGGQGVYDLAITVDPKDEERIFIGGIELWRWDGNLTRVAVEFGDGFNPLYVHADKHYFYWDPTDETGNRMYICSDGGIGKTEDNGQTFSVINRGFNVTQFYGVAFDPISDIVMAGAQDNGTQMMTGDNGLDPLVGVKVFGNDGLDCDISQLVPIAFVTSQYSSVYRGKLQPPFANISDPYNFDPSQPFLTVIRLWESENDLTSKDSIVFENDSTKTTLAFGNGVSKTFSGNVTSLQPSGIIMPGSIRISAGFAELDNSANSGELAGDGTGTVEYNDDGSVSIEVQFDQAPITNASVFVRYNTRFEANALIELRSATGGLPITHRLESDLNSGEKVLVQDHYQSMLTLSIVGSDNPDARLGLYRGALVTTEPVEWFEIDGIGRIVGLEREEVTTTEFTTDGNHLYVGTDDGGVYRVSGLNQLYTTTDIENLTVTEIFRQSNQMTTGIAVDANDPGRIVVTLGNYGNANYVWLLNNAQDATTIPAANAISVQGNSETGLPPMPVYDAEIDINNPSIVLLGTDRGIWATDNIDAGAGNVEWTNENEALTSVPVYDVRQQRRDFSQANNAGVYYFATHGRGVWETGSLVGIEYSGSESGCEDCPNLSDLTIYPNPMQGAGYLKFSAGESGVANLTIYDLIGRSVKKMAGVQMQAGENNVQIYNGDLSKGTYIVTLEMGKEAQASKFVVLR